MTTENPMLGKFNKPMENPQNQEFNLEILQKITEILEKNELESDDLKYLESWLEKHKEFGLEEMGDAEYYDFFQNGRFYLHSSAIFAGRILGGADRMKPMFLEALKDGYMVSKQIAEERGSPKIAGSVEERAVSFDNQNVFLDEAPAKNHFGYALEGPMYKFAPIVLITPAKLLEAHSSLISGKAEGVYFGSGDKDPFTSSHEIQMSLFVMIMPDIKMRSSFIKKTIESLASDENTAQIAKNDKLKKYIDESEKRDIGLKEFTETLIGLLSENGISVPRLSFYQVNIRNLDKNKDVEEIEEGVRKFLVSHNVQTQTELDTSVEPMYLEQNMDIKKLETTANLVRKKLKQIVSIT